MNLDKMILDYNQRAAKLMQEGRELHEETTKLLQQIAAEEAEQSAHWQRVEEKLDLLLEEKGTQHDNP